MLRFGTVILLLLLMYQVYISESRSDTYKFFFEKLNKADDVTDTKQGNLFRVPCQVGYVKIKGRCRKIL